MIVNAGHLVVVLLKARSLVLADETALRSPLQARPADSSFSPGQARRRRQVGVCRRKWFGGASVPAFTVKHRNREVDDHATSECRTAVRNERADSTCRVVYVNRGRSLAALRPIV